MGGRGLGAKGSPKVPAEGSILLSRTGFARLWASRAWFGSSSPLHSRTSATSAGPWGTGPSTISPTTVTKVRERTWHMATCEWMCSNITSFISPWAVTKVGERNRFRTQKVRCGSTSGALRQGRGGPGRLLHRPQRSLRLGNGIGTWRRASEFPQILRI